MKLLQSQQLKNVKVSNASGKISCCNDPFSSSKVKCCNDPFSQEKKSDRPRR